MLRATYAMFMILPALVVGYAACSPQDASEESDGVAEAEISTGPTIFGTFRAEQTHSGIVTLVLKKDSTFHLEMGLVCIRYPCPRPEVNGTFQAFSNNGSNFLVLTSSLPQSTTRDTRTQTQVEYLRYVLRGDLLYVAPFTTQTPVWQALRRSEPAWCSVQPDCDLQGLPPGPCAGNWYCAANACNYTCGPVTCELDGTCPTE